MSSYTSEDTTTKREDFTPGKRMKRRQASLSKVRRNLFGPVDHETTDDFLKKELDILTDRSNCRWNFDFSTEKPLEGKWSWEVVRSGDVPSVYRTMIRVGGHRVTENKDPKRNPLFPVTPSDNRLQDLKSVGCSMKSTNDKSTELQDRQTSLKGFLSVRKLKSKSDLKICNKNHLIHSKRNSRAKSKSPFTQVSSSLPNSASQDAVGD